MDDNIRLKIINEVAKPFSPFVVVLRMCVGVRDNEMAGHRARMANAPMVTTKKAIILRERYRSICSLSGKVLD